MGVQNIDSDIPETSGRYAPAIINPDQKRYFSQTVCSSRLEINTADDVLCSRTSVISRVLNVVVALAQCVVRADVYDGNFSRGRGGCSGEDISGGAKSSHCLVQRRAERSSKTQAGGYLIVTQSL